MLVGVRIILPQKYAALRLDAGQPQQGIDSLQCMGCGCLGDLALWCSAQITRHQVGPSNNGVCLPTNDHIRATSSCPPYSCLDHGPEPINQHGLPYRRCSRFKRGPSNTMSPRRPNRITIGFTAAADTAAMSLVLPMNRPNCRASRLMDIVP